MFKKILLPTDGSELSDKAIDGGLEFAKTLKAGVVGVTVVEPYSYSNLSEYRPETLDDYEQRIMKVAAERLGQVADAAAQGIRAGRNRHGEILFTVRGHHRNGEDQGLRRHLHGLARSQGLSAVLLGSETQKVLTHSTIPVMVYR